MTIKTIKNVTDFETATAPNEIWQDADGALLTPDDEDGTYWYVFGVNNKIVRDHPATRYPLTLVFDATGKAVTEQLNYPNREVIVVNEVEPDGDEKRA